MKKFGIIGGNGGIARIHKECIEMLGGEYIICDIAGIAKFTNYVDMIPNVDVVVICTPNYLHYPMIVDALNANKYVICEKPHALSAREIDRLRRHVNIDKLYPVLQLRYNPDLKELREKYQTGFHDVEMSIKIYRSKPYFQGWKGNQTCSGGLLFNIGIHYFDFLAWFFGGYKGQAQTHYQWMDSSGVLLLDRAVVKWHLDIITPEDKQERIVKINGEEVNLSYQFQNLHQEIYKELSNGSSIKMEDIIPTYSLIENIIRG